MGYYNLNEIKRKTLQAIDTIESRKNVAPKFFIGTDKYKNLKYRTTRSLDEYIELMKFLPKDLNNHLTILDIGCGQGKALQDIKEIYKESVLFGTSVNENDITNNSIKIVEATADSLPFEDNSFDLVLSVHGLSWEPNQRQGLQEVVRVLKPGGKAHIYLIKFSHAVSLFCNENFWDDLDYSSYLVFEYNPKINLKNANINTYEYDYPEEECDGYSKEWYLIISKK